MHEVICNTSPLQYLFQVDLLDMLQDRFDQVLVPGAVEAELAAGRRRNVALPKLEDLDWVTIRSTHYPLPSPIRGLGRGETAVLALGTHMPQAVLLLDDIVDSGWTMAVIAALLRRRKGGASFRA